MHKKYELIMPVGAETRLGSIQARTGNATKRGVITFRRSVQICAITSVKSYCYSHGLSYRVSIPEQECLIYKPVSLDGEVNGGVDLAIQPEVYIAELNDVQIIGGTSAVIAGEGICLRDKIPQWENRVCFCDRVTQDLGNNLNFNVVESDSGIIKEGIMLCGSGTSNYFHWIFEFLTRFYLLDSYPEYKDVPILIDEGIIRTPQLLEALYIFNQNMHGIIIVKEAHKYQVKRLILPSYLVWLPTNLNKGVRLKYNDTVVSKHAIGFLRQRLANSNCVSKGYRRLYISRKNMRARKMVNEAEIQQIFESYGFQTIYPETMTFTEQQKIFGEAEIIAGNAGSAMSNMIFAPLHTRILCITSVSLLETSLFSTIAGLASQDIVFLKSRPLDENPANYHPSMYLHPEVLRKSLDTLIQK